MSNMDIDLSDPTTKIESTPEWLRPIIKLETKKYAAIWCSIQNLTEKIKSRNEAIESNTLPRWTEKAIKKLWDTANAIQQRSIIELVLKNPSQDTKLAELKEIFDKRHEKFIDLVKQIANSETPIPPTAKLKHWYQTEFNLTIAVWKTNQLKQKLVKEEKQPKGKDLPEMPKTVEELQKLIKSYLITSKKKDFPKKTKQNANGSKNLKKRKISYGKNKSIGPKAK